MIVILEGAERTGKTTIAKMLEKRGFIYVKDSVRLYNGDIKHISLEETNNRIDAALNYLEKLSESNENVVIDRFHISNAVFADYYRQAWKKEDETYVKFYDSILSHIDNVKLCLFEREINNKYIEEHPVFHNKESLKRLVDSFKYYFDKSQIKNKIRFDLDKDNPEYIVEYIMEQYPFDELEEPDETIIASHVKTRDPEPKVEKIYNFYLASPFFNDEQIERMHRVLDMLREWNYLVYAPFEHGVVKADDLASFAQEIFQSNIEAIKQSDMVLAITDGKDMGTIWEAGYAYGIGVPVVYYAETLGDNPFNIMLSGSGIGVYTDFNILSASAGINNFTYKEEVKHE